MGWQYTIILLGAFVLEAAGYVAFPYLSLRLRDGLGLSEQFIGTIFLVAIWLRPLGAIIGGYLSERARPIAVFTTACLAESLCFTLLAIANHWAVAALAIFIGNIGFSLWNPNLFALVYRFYGTENATSKISLLNGALNAGAAVGCLLGGLVATFDMKTVFLGAGLLYLLSIPLLGSVIYLDRAEATDKSPKAKQKLPLKTWGAVILASFGFWASYAQFNSFFALFAKDWMGNNAITGFSFGFLAVLVALFSFLISRLKKLGDSIRILTVGSGLLFIFGWWAMVASPSLAGLFPFLLGIACGETCFSIYLAERWARLQTSQAHFMQSLNFAVRNISMGLGSFVGGYVYHYAHAQKNLALWGAENACLIFLAIAGILIAPLSLPKQARG